MIKKIEPMFFATVNNIPVIQMEHMCSLLNKINELVDAANKPIFIPTPNYHEQEKLKSVHIGEEIALHACQKMELEHLYKTAHDYSKMEFEGKKLSDMSAEELRYKFVAMMGQYCTLAIKKGVA